MSRSHAPAGRLLLACVLIALGSSTWGSDPVYKCRDHAGQAHYQASPCPATQHTEWRREYPDKPSALTDTRPIAARRFALWEWSQRATRRAAFATSRLANRGLLAVGG